MAADAVTKRPTSRQSVDAAVSNVLHAVSALWLVAIMAGLILHQDMDKEELRALKKTLPLVWFDNLLKRYGSIMPLLPFSARWLASALADRRKQNVTPAIHFAEAGCMYVAISIGRLAIYILHIIGVLHLVLRIVLPVSSQEAKQSEVMSDHLFLGSSLLAILTTELLLGYRELKKACNERKQELARIAFLVFGTAVSAAFGLGTIFDMYYTAKYFHGPFEILGTMVVGWLMFQWPLYYWLLNIRQ